VVCLETPFAPIKGQLRLRDQRDKHLPKLHPMAFAASKCLRDSGVSDSLAIAPGKQHQRQEAQKNRDEPQGHNQLLTENVVSAI